MLIRFIFLCVLLVSVRVQAQSCPGADDEPALTVKTKGAHSLMVCGREDRAAETESAKLVFSEFNVYSWSQESNVAKKIFSGDPSIAYSVRVLKDKGLQVQEMWLLLDDPQPALQREIVCLPKVECQVGAPKCVLKFKKNPFPKALKSFQAMSKPSGDAAEDLLDQVLVQALSGDVAAIKFYSSPAPEMSPELRETFEDNVQRLKQAREFKCLPGNV